MTAPPPPGDGHRRLRHGFDRIAAWERTEAFERLGARRPIPLDLTDADAVETAMEQLTISYGHMVGTCPMGTVLDAGCRVVGVDGLRVVDASVMPTIPSGNTYLGTGMVAERVAREMTDESQHARPDLTSTSRPSGTDAATPRRRDSSTPRAAGAPIDRRLVSSSARRLLVGRAVRRCRVGSSRRRRCRADGRTAR